jgi:hypothetical protein
MIKKDAIETGLVIGIVAPVLAFLIYYFAKFSGYSITELLRHIIILKLLSPVISLSLVANLLAFFIFIWLKADKSAKGVLLATFIYGAVIVFLIYFS